MARNTHPEVTRTRILDAAQRLFMAQGYEHTSIQNIVDELGDLSPKARATITSNPRKPSSKSSSTETTICRTTSTNPS